MLVPAFTLLEISDLWCNKGHHEVSPRIAAPAAGWPWLLTPIPKHEECPTGHHFSEGLRNGGCKQRKKYTALFYRNMYNRGLCWESLLSRIVVSQGLGGIFLGLLRDLVGRAFLSQTSQDSANTTMTRWLEENPAAVLCFV